MSYKKDVLKGTAILTSVGMMTKVLGMINRVYLANLISAEQLGIYQMIFPILLICSALCAYGIQNAISRMVAKFLVVGRVDEIRCLVKLTLLFSVGLSTVLGFAVSINATWLSMYLLKESACGPYLKILAWVLPFSTLHTCLCGYFLGMQNARVPAISQFMEQVVRVLGIYCMSLVWRKQRMDASIAIYGMLFGEIASAAYMVISYQRASSLERKSGRVKPARVPLKALVKELSNLAVPLTINKLLLSLMQSALAIMIPWLLKDYYNDRAQALSIFGVLTGMSMPFITFPSTMTNALASMLLPAVSMAHAKKNMRTIQSSVSKSLEYCLYTGILAMGGFVLYGQALGEFFFKNTMSGILLQLFAYICPFIYITATLSSTLNGMGEAKRTLIYNMAAISVEMLMLWLFVPRFGLKGYLWALLGGNLLLCFLNIRGIVRLTGLVFNSKRAIVIPGSFVCIAGLLAKTGEWFLLNRTTISSAGLMFLCGGGFCFIYLVLLYKTGMLKV